MGIREALEARYLRVVSSAPDGVFRTAEFTRHQHRLPRRRPVTFNEKVDWRIRHDRRPELGWTCDKLTMKEHAAAVPGLRVPATLWTGTDVGELAARELPQRWVLKPNHRSGVVHLGTGRPDVTSLAAITDGWLDEVHARDLREWAYSRARRTLLVEEYVEGGEACDLKFFVFDGVVRAVLVNRGRFQGLHQVYYTRDWTPIEATMGSPRGEIEARPADLEHLLALAETLAAGWDFMRIDLYRSGGEVWFSETTPYPGSAFIRCRPRSLDHWLGGFWTLPGQ